MVVEEVVSVLSPELTARMGSLITIFKAVSIAFVAYVIYLLVKAVLTWKTNRRVGKIEKKVNSIDKKLDILLKSKGKKGKK